ncbi:hypothetical protein M9H77_18116 [Catharanthus roseus]|uniref:Uncharacterized protein n=1 Tax=Catharanthus roseus TaxID=4058 RepID=A0ACC0B6L2_CATRO|nr:hypothetical protein M9H77_18116 [Catharanthus roseus]
MESTMDEIPTKANELSQAQDEEKSREEKLKTIVSTKESKEKIKESECFIENHESLKEEQVKVKQDQIEKGEKRKEEISLMIFERDKREEMRAIQPQSLNFLATTCGKKSNHGMKAKEEGMEKELSISFKDTSLNCTLPVTAGLPLPLPVGFFRDNLGDRLPTAQGRSDPTVAGRSHVLLIKGFIASSLRVHVLGSEQLNCLRFMNLWYPIDHLQIPSLIESRVLVLDSIESKERVKPLNIRFMRLVPYRFSIEV